MSKIILSIIFLLVSVISTKASSIDNIVNALQSSIVENLTLSTGKDNKEIVTAESLLESVFLKAPSHPTLLRKVEERTSLTALFLSSFSFGQITKNYSYIKLKFNLQFVPHSLSIIYPHHHFW